MESYRHELVITSWQARHLLSLRTGDRGVVGHPSQDLLVARDLVTSTTLRLCVPRVRVVVLDRVARVDKHPSRVAPALLQDVLHHRLELAVREAVAVPSLFTSLRVWGIH